MKKLLVLLALTLLTLSLFALAEEPETFTSGDFEYVLLPDGTAEITKYSGNAESLDIPSALDGYKVTSIGDHAFYYSYSLTAVTIPDSVTAIGANPFMFCDKLKTISVSPEHPYLATIDGVLFSKPDRRLVCYPFAFDASEYAIPQGIQTIGDCAFYDCDSLTAVTIPDSVTSIGFWAFSYCGSLTAVTIPDSVTSIGDYAFYDCDSLTAIAIPDSVTSIGYGAFCHCESLSAVTIPDSVTSICVRAFEDCSSLTAVVIPDSVTSIGESAFEDCNSLTAVTIPDSVTFIGDEAFFNCMSLTAVTIPDSVTSIGKDAFTYCAESLTITVGRNSYAEEYCRENGLQYAYPDALDWLKG